MSGQFSPSNLQNSSSPSHKAIVYKTSKKMAIPIEELERSVCFICATEHPPLWAITECSHRVCALCSLRMRALYENKVCAMCKCESARVVVVRAHVDAQGDDHTRSFEELWSARLVGDEGVGMYFADDKLRDKVLAVRKMTCPVPKCREAMRTFPSKNELKRHVNDAHQLTFCDICLAHKKVFPSEFTTYNKTELLCHQKCKETGHPSCDLCGTLFYSEDELFTHRRERHEQCHICRRHPGRPSYFRDSSELEAHFQRDHFQCPEALCTELKFVVFETEMELKVHRAEMHLTNQRMQRSMHNQLRRLDPDLGFIAHQPSDRHGTQQRRQPEQVLPAAAPTPAVSLVAVEPIPRSISRHFVFGEGMADLAQRLQSLTLYEQRNIEFCNSLLIDHKLSEGAVGSLKGLCRAFQKGELSAVDVACRIEALVGYETMEQLAPTLLELQLNNYKRTQLDAAIQTRLKLVAAFPPLPKASASASASGPCWKAPLTASAITQRSGPAGILRIKPAGKPGGQKINSGTDPSKNPSALLGVRSAASLSTRPAGVSAAQSTTKISRKNAPSFRQAIASSSSTAIVANETARVSLPARNDHEFPSLLANPTFSPRKNTVTHDAAARSQPSLFANSENRNLPESFVIGSNDLADQFAMRRDQAIMNQNGASCTRGGEAKKKGKKGQVFLRYG